MTQKTYKYHMHILDPSCPSGHSLTVMSMGPRQGKNVAGKVKDGVKKRNA